MINFKVSDISEGLISVIKPVGKPIPLNIGEIVRGEVTDILSTGGVTLKIKGSYITAKTDVALQKNSEVLLKVVGTPASPNELRLQFMGEVEKEQAAPALRNDAVSKLVQQFSGSAGDVEGLLRSLPADITSLPKDIRTQLQAVLSDSLKAAGQNIQSRLDELLENLPAGLKNQLSFEGLKLDTTSDIDKLPADKLKGLLSDTGVALESKLKALAELAQQAPPEDMPRSAAVDNDLKANLMKLKDALEAQTHGLSAKDATAVRNASAAVDSLLKDIETYQLLSKTTESFYTFLPVGWQQLKDAEIALKQNKEQGGAAQSFSCRLSLDLEGSGKLVIMVLLQNNEFFVSFRPENADFQSLLSAHSDALEDQFRGKGLNLKAVRVLDKDDTSLEQLENLEPFKGIVNIKA